MNNLQEQRNKIDELDGMLINLLGERSKVVENIKKIKQEHNVPIEDMDREAEMKDKRSELCKEYGVNEDLIDSLFTIIIDASKKVQE